MADNRVVVYKGPGEVEVEDIEYPKLEVPEEVASAMGMTIEAPHAVILKIISTNICGSDQHMVRGRTTAPVGQTLGHEITGEVIEKGNDVQFIDIGDLCSVPFNIACGRCRNCKERKTGVCLNVNPARAGSAYGYVDMGGWVGGKPCTSWSPSRTSTCSSSLTKSRRWRRSWTSRCSRISSPPATTAATRRA
jgi:glutathione-independent formaldehyde dehydrogenase